MLATISYWFNTKGNHNLKSERILYLILTIFVAATPVCAEQTRAETLHLIQKLTDGKNGVDGLDNPRNINVSLKSRKLFVTSGDDNSLAVFSIGKDFTLQFQQVFKNSESHFKGLEGAVGLVSLKNGGLLLTTGFYDGALSIFSKSSDGQYQFSEVISNRFDVHEALKGNLPSVEKDSFGLIGAWGVTKTRDEKEIFTASYMSNAISNFHIDKDGNVNLHKVIRGANPLANSLGKPVDLALSPSNEELFVLGFDDHQLSIFARHQNGELSIKQILHLGELDSSPCLNPQKIIVSPSGEHLYLACSGNASIMVLSREENGDYAQVQSILNDEIGNGLEGASSLALTNDGSRLFAAGEQAFGMLIFDVKTNGRLSMSSRLSNSDKKFKDLTSISSINLTEDNQYLLITAAKSDSLWVFKTSL